MYVPHPPSAGNDLTTRIDLDELNLPYDPSTFDLIHIRFAHSRVRPLFFSSSTMIRHISTKLTLTQVRSFATLLSQAFTLLRPGGLLLLFDYDLLPILADESTPLSAQAWHDAFSKSMKKAGMPLFGLEKVLPCFGGREVEGKDMRVPIGHGDGASPQSFFASTVPLTYHIPRKHILLSYTPPKIWGPRRKLTL
jgi:hypothetical protein